MTLAKSLPSKWETLAREGDHYKLAFDQPGTWSQKYNLVWDQILSLRLFPASVSDMEWKSYSKQIKQYAFLISARQSYPNSHLPSPVPSLLTGEN